jgi:cytochrome oxidase Cu insertion factor (SCO1/SenC/PrrC family)
MTLIARPILSRVLLATTLVIVSLLSASRPATAVEVGQPAPGFTLPATTGGDISLSDFRGKKFVLVEFYGADFAPT